MSTDLTTATGRCVFAVSSCGFGEGAIASAVASASARGEGFWGCGVLNLGICTVAITCLPAAFAVGLAGCLAAGFPAGEAHEVVPVYVSWGPGLED